MTETWPTTLPPQNALQEAIHARHWNTRFSTIMALEESYHKHHKSLAYRLATCSNGAAFYVSPATHKVKPWLARCGSRLCPFCSVHRSTAIAARILAATNLMKQPRLAVLTVKSTDTPLANQLAALRHAFARLRRYKAWKSHVTGGIYPIETTRNAQTGQWHPHVHIIMDGSYFAQAALRIAWHKATGTAEIVWIERVSDRSSAAAELAKYVGKPQQIHTWPNAAIREYATAAMNQRMLHTFGNLHGVKVADEDKPEPLDPNEFSITIGRIVHLANEGFMPALFLADAIANRWPLFAPYILHHMPQLSPRPLLPPEDAAARAALRDRDPPTAPGPPPLRDAQALDEELFRLMHQIHTMEEQHAFDFAQAYRSFH
jgi:hypothetical protein